MTNSMDEEIKSGKKYALGRLWDYIRDHEWALVLCWHAGLWIGCIILFILTEISWVFFFVWVVFFLWFIIYRLGKWKGRKKWMALDKKVNEENSGRIRLSQQKKYTNKYYDNPNHHPPNAYGYCGTEREDEELMNAIRDWPEDRVKDEKSNNPPIEAQKKELKNLLTKGLTRAERLIVVLYYYEKMTIKEVAEKLDLSEACVSQMHSSIIARLKSDM